MVRMCLNRLPVTIIGVALLLLPLVSQAKELPAFPGAEGYGANTPGGRGGKVILVTNRNDSGPGSLRAACETKGPRIVVFRIAGVIDLETPVEITEPYITIAAQTAPGDGICLRQRGIGIKTVLSDNALTAEPRFSRGNSRLVDAQGSRRRCLHSIAIA